MICFADELCKVFVRWSLPKCGKALRKCLTTGSRVRSGSLMPFVAAVHTLNPSTAAYSCMSVSSSSTYEREFSVTVHGIQLYIS